MEALIIELAKLILPAIGALAVLWITNRRAKKLGLDEESKRVEVVKQQYIDLQEKLRDGLREELQETKADFEGCKKRLIETLGEIRLLHQEVADLTQEVFDLRLELSKTRTGRVKPSGTN